MVSELCSAESAETLPELRMCVCEIDKDADRRRGWGYMALKGRGYLSGARLMTALIVERNFFVRILHAILFKRSGFKIYVVTSGEEAIDLINLGKKFDIIIMGMTFPITKGVQEIREIRAIGVDNMIIGTDVKGYLTHDNNNCCEIGLDRIYELPLTPEIVASLHNELMVRN
ncbi:two-component response regulator 24-like [Apium graveolens]|uniref:two-component response regulator 24-like n=1 Tax=Apium graveolens TaxID=4045 RepID=UPI003D78DCC6